MRIFDQENQETSSTNYFELLDVYGVSDMKWSRGGDFTKNLLSLQLQVKTLLEGVGGEGTAVLLDGIAQLSPSDRSKVIPILSRVISRIAQGDKWSRSDEERSLKEFEDCLFESISSALGQSENNDEVQQPPHTSRSLGVVSGGKSTNASAVIKKPIKVPSLIDLAKARESRRSKLDSSPNELA